MPSEELSWRERRNQLRAKRKQEEGPDNDDAENDLHALSHLLENNHGSSNRKELGRQNSRQNDSYVPHLSAAKRMRMEREKVLRTMAGGDGAAEGDGDGGATKHEGGESTTTDRSAMAKSRKKLAAVGSATTNVTNGDTESDGEGEDQAKDQVDDEEEDADAAAQSLLEQAARLRQTLTESERKELAKKEEETRILKEASKVQTNALQAASELAHGVVYNESLPTSWICPKHILNQGEEGWNKIRKNWHILVEGFDPPPPMKSFEDMRFPNPILEFLKERNIKRPTPIQMQGLPVALAGRDMVGIAFTGSGKTMTFSLPLIMAALEEEVRMPLVGGEGPVGIILAPSRELVRQTYELVNNLCEALGKAGYPKYDRSW